ncbi:MAG: sigma-70 family RNA polymerase sigma factor [Pirellulales bacterium]|nr:sigma-70 family RNA polymerase sigma factor [Pirellulales bacterium]
MSEVTRILQAIDEGDPHATEELLPLVYNELRRLAAQKLSHEKPGQTLQATALVHEAYLRLVGKKDPHWNSRGHFFAAAAEAMRRILIDQARKKRTIKAGGELRRIGLSRLDPETEAQDLDVLALNEALEKLEAEMPRKAALVKLRFFAGLTVQQAAMAIGISATTADADWTYAKCWLRVAMTASD